MFENQPGAPNAVSQKTLQCIDVSGEANSVQALRVVESWLQANGRRGEIADVNAGYLLLTRGIMAKVMQMLRKYGMRPGTLYTLVPQTQQAALDEGFAVRGRPDTGMEAAGLSFDLEQRHGRNQPVEEVALPAFQGEMPAHLVDKPAVELEIEELLALVEGRKIEAAHTEPVPEQYTAEPLPESDLKYEIKIDESRQYPTLTLKQTLRSGQVVRYDGNIVIIGDVHAGSEIHAHGDITVWGELRGIAHAGSQGYGQAEIRAMKIDAIQLRIAEHIARRPDRIYYHKDSGVSPLAPELAKVAEGEIRIFKELFGK